MNGVKKDIIWRLNLSLLLISIVGVAVIIQIGKIQFVDGDKYRDQAKSEHVKYETIPAKRGNIYADGGDLLAASFPYYNIIIDPGAPSQKDFSQHLDSLSLGLSKIFGDKSKSDYKKIISSARKSGKRYIVLYKKATVPQMQAAKELPLFNKGKYAGGLVIEQFEKRNYPYGTLANRTIGYTKEGVKVGLEGAYDAQLSGTPGKELVQKISGGTWMPISDEAAVEPIDGFDITTTLDVNIQDITETALRRTLVENNAAWGTALVMEVKTGKIKAIANLTKTGEGLYSEILNYAVSQGVEPGSTFKLFSLMCLFDDGFVTENDTVDLNNGEYRFNGGTMWDSEGRHGRRNVSVKTAFALSSNVGISRLVNQYYQSDKSKYLKHLEDAGLTHKTGVEIAGEAKPQFKMDPDADNWYGTTLPWMSVGYEIHLTPLQLLTFYNAIANDGKLMKPYLVESTSRFGETYEEFEPVVLNEKICSEQTIHQLKDCLFAVVDSGTAKHLKNEYYDFAGKTGTAKLLENGSYGHKYLASFAGYFPAENPKYSILVSVNSPSNGKFYGGSVSAPVFREIADKLYSHHLGINEPINENDSLRIGVNTSSRGYSYDLEKVLSWLKINSDFKRSDEWIAMQVDGKKSTAKEVFVKQNEMPSVKGMGLKDALYVLENAGLKVNPVGKGKVSSQSIDAGQFIQKGNYVTIVLN